jgi:hypothetical protein
VSDDGTIYVTDDASTEMFRCLLFIDRILGRPFGAHVALYSNPSPTAVFGFVYQKSCTQKISGFRTIFWDVTPCGPI